MTGINERIYVSHDAFSDAVATHHRRLAGLAYLLCGDKDVAEDLVAEAYAKVWPKYRQHQVEDLGPYLRQAVVNLATGRLRRLRLERRETQRRTVDWRIAEDRDAPSFETSVDERDDLWQAIWRLPADQRAVIVLRLVEDLSEEATAKVLGTRPGTVKSRLSRGLATLRFELSTTAFGSDMKGDDQ